MTLTVQPLGRKRTFTDHLGIPKENMICRGCSKDKTAVTPSEATNQQRTGDVDRTFSPAQRLLAKLRRSFAVKGSESPHASTEFTTSVHTARNHDSINNRSTDELCQACAKRKQHLRRSFHGRASDPWVPSDGQDQRGYIRLESTECRKMPLYAGCTSLRFVMFRHRSKRVRI
ncbi:hypothetical protein BC832DRAFT_116710 [Gaertneriomyces semiglobifer]|nr:hypothetical protein BC832DRAFT_116710 [Gaertneriomyces semiglobifer]